MQYVSTVVNEGIEMELKFLILVAKSRTGKNLGKTRNHKEHKGKMEPEKTKYSFSLKKKQKGQKLILFLRQ